MHDSDVFLPQKRSWNGESQEFSNNTVTNLYRIWDTGLFISVAKHFKKWVVYLLENSHWDKLLQKCLNLVQLVECEFPILHFHACFYFRPAGYISAGIVKMNQEHCFPTINSASHTEKHLCSYFQPIVLNIKCLRPKW